MMGLPDISTRHRLLIDDIAKQISNTPDPNAAASLCVDIVAQWLVAPATDLALPDTMHYSTHATAFLLGLGAPLDD